MQRQRQIDAALGGKLESACEFLEHYHQEHTSDKITRFISPSPGGVEIYIVSDPEWKAKFRGLAKDELEEPTVH